MAPHSTLNISSAEANVMVRLCLFGKDLQRGGNVRLENINTGEAISVFVKDSVWSHYQSNNKLYVLSGDRLRLSMSAGGIAPSAMLVDLLEITGSD